VSDDPPKTLSSRSKTLSKLQPVDLPRNAHTNAQRIQGWLPAPATPAAAD